MLGALVSTIGVAVGDMLGCPTTESRVIRGAVGLGVGDGETNRKNIIAPGKTIGTDDGRPESKSVG